MAAIAGQPAPKPSSLPKPVPGADEDAAIAEVLASFDAPEIESAEDAAVNEVVMEAGAEPTDDQFAPEPGFVEANTPGPDVFSNFITRFQAGLAANETEKVGFLKQKYGDKNVALRDGNIYYRKNDKEKLKRLDPATFELMADIIPDFAREIVTEGAMLPAEVGGGVMMGPGGALMGRVASVPMANSLADSVAQAAGIPLDPTRNQRTENMIGQTAETLLPMAGRAVVNQVAKRIPGTLAYKAAREAGEKEAVALSRSSQEVLQAANELEEAGLQVNIMAHQMHPTSPQLESVVSSVDKTGQFQARQQEFAEGYGDLVKNTLSEITRRSNPNGKIPEGKVASTITNAVRDLDKAEGVAIGQFKAKAMSELKNKKVALAPQTSQAVSGFMKEFGFAIRPTADGKSFSIRPPSDLRPYVGKHGLKTIGEVRTIVNNLNDLAQNSKDDIRVTDLERFRGVIGEAGRSLRGTPAGASLSRLSSDLRQTYRQTIESGLADPFDKKAYSTVMDDYSAIRQGTEQLQDVLRGDVTTRAIVNGFFKGKENLANIRALKKITGADSPEWGALKEEFISQLMVKHSNDGLTGFNSKSFLKDLDSNYGPDFIKEVLNDGKAGPDYATVKNLLTVGKRIEQTQRGVKVNDITQKQADALAEGAFGFFSGASFRMLNATKKLLQIGGDKESALMEVFNRDGYEKYLASYAGKNKSEIAEKTEKLLADYNAVRQANKRVGAVLDAGKNIVKRGTRATIREDVMRTD